MPKRIFTWGPIGGHVSIFGTPSTQYFDSSGDSGWLKFQVPKTGTISYVGCHVQAVTGSPPAMKVGIYNLDANGVGPNTSSPYGSMVAASYTVSAPGWQWVNLGSPASATKGDWVVAGFHIDAVNPDGSNKFAYSIYGMYLYGMPYHELGYMSSRFEGDGGTLAVKYDDGEICGLAFTDAEWRTATLRANTTPDEWGAKFTLEHAFAVNGAKFQHGSGSGSSAVAYTIKLYDASDNVLRSTTTPVGWTGSNDDISGLWAPIVLAANRTYRVTIQGDSSANGSRYLRIPMESAAAKLVFPCGGDWQECQRTDNGAWTDTPLSLPASRALRRRFRRQHGADLWLKNFAPTDRGWQAANHRSRQEQHTPSTTATTKSAGPSKCHAPEP